MIWLTWRQFRTQAITVYAGIAVLAIFLARPRGAAAAAHAGDPDAAVQAVTAAPARPLPRRHRCRGPPARAHRCVLGRAAGRPRARGRHAPPRVEPVRDPYPLARDQARPHRCDGDGRGGAVQPGRHMVGGSARPARGVRRRLRTTRFASSPLLFASRGVAPGRLRRIRLRPRRDGRNPGSPHATGDGPRPWRSSSVVQIAVPLWVRPHVVPPVQQTAAITQTAEIGRFEVQLGEVLVIEAVDANRSLGAYDEILGSIRAAPSRGCRRGSGTAHSPAQEKERTPREPRRGQDRTPRTPCCAVWTVLPTSVTDSTSPTTRPAVSGPCSGPRRACTSGSPCS